MLGVEPDIVANYVETGQVKVIFWPVLNHGNPSLISTVAAECAGQQNADLFWEIHDLFFANQRELWSAGRSYYVETAVSIGADRETFERCYDGPEGVATVMELDEMRRQRGIYGQPIFDINGQLIGGYQSFDTFAGIFASSLP